MTLEQLLEYLKSQRRFMDNVTHWQLLPAQEARYADFPQTVDEQLQYALRQKSIQKLYTHQAEAYQYIKNGKNVVIVTPTASGKTLAYNLPVLNEILNDREARALYLFPTKALSQDQYSELHDLVTILDVDIRTYTFDGDTPVSARQAIRRAGHIVITNPDMLHQGILPHHTIWLKLFENLRFVVIDELHYYRGVFGSHLANVVRRLKRIARFYGSNPRFICCSATIANPKELAEKIVEEPFELLNRNGAPRGRKHFIFYNPPLVDKQLGIRRSVLKEVNRISRNFLETGVQSIVFARSRVRVEVLTRYLKEQARTLKVGVKRIRGYRGGYLPLERREIERGLRSGEILGVVSTNALELGIDIGQLDVAILAGYPGSIASAWQQAGRAGRRSKTSVAIMIASSSPLDQYIINHPEYFFEKSPEHGIVDPDNLLILMSHIKCAAFEIPFLKDELFSSIATREILEYLAEKNILRESGGKYHWMSEIYPAEEVSLRSASPDNVVIIDTTEEERVIGETDLFSAPMLVHQEAIYMHESRQYHVDQLDWDRKKAYVRQVDVDYYTDAITKTDIKVLNLDEEKKFKDLVLVYGEINVNSVTTGYKKIKLFTHENVGAGRVFLPELEMATNAGWLEFPLNITGLLCIQESEFSSALQSIANALRNIAPVYLMCDPSDIRALPMMRSPFSQHPTIYLYDNFPGGMGLSFKLFNDPVPTLQGCLDLVQSCGCESGCPSCVGPVLETGENAREHAFRLLKFVLEELNLSKMK
jgi:DEAD/DEAH box helicase domain-containing protein